MLNQGEQLLEVKTTTLHSLYEQYAGMLLGYISAIVQDKELAESYLVSIFNKVAQQFNDISWSEGSTWHQLRNVAKHELTTFTQMVQSCEYDAIPSAANHKASNKYLSRMNGDQKHVFCSVYYYKQTTAQLSQELNQPESFIHKCLKEAFAIIKQSHEN